MPTRAGAGRAAVPPCADARHRLLSVACPLSSSESVRAAAVAAESKGEVAVAAESKGEVADPHAISLSFEIDGPANASAPRHHANAAHAPLQDSSLAAPATASSAMPMPRTTRAKYSANAVVPEPLARTPARLDGYSSGGGGPVPSPGGTAGSAAAVAAAEGRARIVAQARAGLQQRSVGTPLQEQSGHPRTAEIARYM